MESKQESCLDKNINACLICDKFNKNNNTLKETTEVSISDNNNIQNKNEKNSYQYSKINNNTIISKIKFNLKFLILLTSFIFIISTIIFFYFSTIIIFQKEKRKLSNGRLEFSIKIDFHENRQLINPSLEKYPDQIIIVNVTDGTQNIICSNCNGSIPDGSYIENNIIKLIYFLNGDDFLNCSEMFIYSNIYEINITGNNYPFITSMFRMFMGCFSLTDINFININFSNVETLEESFCDCKSLLSINLSNLNMKKVISTQDMFSDCISLKLVDFRNTEFYNLKTMKNMFNTCNSLSSIIFFGGYLPNLINMEDAFFECSS